MPDLIHVSNEWRTYFEACYIMSPTATINFEFKFKHQENKEIGGRA
jgi:hypothetical protein